ncbi:MAG: pre-peptidase C-terminal domain-containing protein [Oculatellaceae cyanobacterium bins.114]|nr:pre-peptidase C-terminal domain-containing protein [Oculatellaceae cyanobacterium bins.114]
MARAQQGNTLRTARTTVVGPTARTLRGALSATDGNDFWKFTLAVRSTFNLNLTGIGRTANADALLLNSRGGTIRALRSPKNRPERLSNLSLDPGTYYVRVQRRTGTTRYALSLAASPISTPTPTPTPGVTPTPTPGVTPTPSPTDNGGNSFAASSALVPGIVPAVDFNTRSLTDFVGDVDPQDIFSFSPTTAGNLSLQLTGLTADASIQLFDANQSLIASGDANDSLLQNIAQPGGTYYIRVFQAAAGNNTNYTLNLALTPIDTVGDTAAAATVINDLVATTPPAARQPTAVRTEFVSGSDIDFYRFDLTAQNFVGIDLLNQSGNADLELYKDNAGTPTLLLSSTRGVGAPEQIGGTLSAGTYYIRVAAGAGATGSPYSFTMYAESTLGLPTITRDIAFGATGGQASSQPRDITNVSGTVYFAANEPGIGAGLWRSTGGTAGGNLDQTVKIRNFSSLSNFVAAGNNLYFVADDGQSGTELWKYDGNTAIQLTNNPGSAFVTNLTAVGDFLYFTLSDVNALTDQRLWRSNGTAVGTAEVGDPNTAIAEAGVLPNNLVAVGNDLYYAATDSATVNNKGREVWKITGAGTNTPGTAAIVLDLEPGSSGSAPTRLTAIGTNLFFVAETIGDSVGTELRRLDSNGTLTTFDVSAVNDPFGDSVNPIATAPLVWNIVEMGGNVYFAADGGDAKGEELWRVPVNGAAGSGTRVTDIRLNTGSSNPRNLTVLNNKLFFLADDGTNGVELYVYDGTTTTLLTGGRPADAPDIQELTTSGTNLYFTMGSGSGNSATGRELWVSDGTVVGTEIVFDIRPGGTVNPGTPGDPTADPPIPPTPQTFTANTSNPTDLTDASGRLFFAADNGLNGVELWTLI